MKHFATRIGLLLLLTTLLAACAREAARPRVLWPAPPERPRLEWIQNYYSQDDFPKTATQISMEKMLGKPPLLFFARPFGIAANVDRGLVYISDSDLKEVRIFDMVNYKIHRLNAVTAFGRPLGMTIDTQGNLYVCDGYHRSVMVFGPDHQPLRTIGGKELLENPAYVQVNERLGRIYVADGKASKVVIFDMQGERLREFGSFGSEQGQFRAPQGMAIDNQDRLFVADQLNARVQVFDADGNFLYMFGERAERVSGFESPKDLAFDSEGNLHILDTRKSLLLSYTPEGRLLLHTGGQKASTSPVGFALPTSIFIGRDDRIYITDAFNMRFSVWQYLSEAYLARNPLR